MMISNEQDGLAIPRLPADPAYWGALSRRIVAGAEPVLEELRTWEPWWNPLAKLGPPLGVGAIAAAFAVAWFVASGHGAPGPEARFEYAFAPRDPVARGFVLSAAPPDISTLFPLRQEDPE